MQYVRLSEGILEDISLRYNQETAKLLLNPGFLKRNEYQSESEVRFITSGPEMAGDMGITLQGANATEWIERILLWPGLKQFEEMSIQRVVGHFASGIKCGRSGLFGAEQTFYDGSDMPVTESFNEIFFNAWNDGSDEIPSELKNL